MKTRALSIALLLCAASLTGFAADVLSVRLVEASHDGTVVDRELTDVAPLLKRNMPFTSYRLVDARTVPLPAATVLEMRQKYTVGCDGAAADLKVTVARAGEELLRTTAALNPGKPLILGGFASDRGRILLILLLR
jgi:hypothetical protein